ncbi:membrane-bound lytic murein transglycosylase D [bacterium A37T11]|nr:membrane-bound lytic murein transglycosylase D [bacterium A37T11]
MIFNRKISFALFGFVIAVNFGQAQIPKTSDLNTINIAANAAISEVPAAQNDSSRMQLAQRMSLSVSEQFALMQKQVPMSYNEHVQNYIDTYTSEKRRHYLSRMLGLSSYYFPIYERVFSETGLPEEIKYLSIVESALDPNAVSRVGATGPWQFMFATARLFGLSIDNYIDERKDPVAASYAASAYLKDAFNEYGDWLLAIASYNCGKGNVNRAIQRSGKSTPSFWDIMPYLPRETRNYVPAYLALTYVLTNHDQWGITPETGNMILQTETIQIDKPISLQIIAKALSVDIRALQLLNPAYKKEVINGSYESPKRLVVPQVDKSAYTNLYAALNGLADQDIQVIEASEDITKTAKPIRLSYHRVRRGETLGTIAKKFQVEVQDLKAWNHIKGSAIVPGQRLKIAFGKIASGKALSMATATYRVKRGDTLSEIADKNGITVSKLKAANNIRNNKIRAGMLLKIAQN